jgi:phosphatidylinositol-3-phosphatase
MSSKAFTVTLALFACTAVMAESASAQLAKCASGKLKTTGKAASGTVTCDSKADSKGVGVDPLCTGKAGTKLTTAFTKADEKGPCTGLATTVQAAVDQFEGDTNAAVGNANATRTLSKCDSKKVAAIGKKAFGKLKCHAKAVSKGLGVDPGCLTTAEGKFGLAIGKALALPDCSNASAAAALETIVDEFVDQVIGDLGTGTTTTTTTPPSTTTTIITMTTTTTTTSTTLPAVFLIVMGSRDWGSIKGNSAANYINNLLLTGAHAEQDFNPPGVHPSEPNYIWLEAGRAFGIVTDFPPSINHQATTSHLVSLLDAAGISWKAYQEDISGTVCPLTDVGSYVVRHDPFVFFDDVTGTNNPNGAYCIAHVRPYSELPGDLFNNTVARYNFITPNVCHDMQSSCSGGDPIADGDTWLSSEVPTILASRAYTDGGLLLITWDQAVTGDGPIGLIALSPQAKVGYQNVIHYTHSSVLRTIQEVLGVTPLLSDAANATDLSDLFVALP